MNEYSKQQTVLDGWIFGNLPEGCRLCIQGMKMVYFMGGDCNNPSHCSWYCPLSENRKKKNAFFIDELPIEKFDSLHDTIEKLVYEGKLIEAQGMSITGGDPLSTNYKVDWVCAIIKGIKIEFGDDFHIHLYTSGKTFDIFTADKLELAGLDNIRFHPSIEDFDKIQFAMNRRYTVGAEVPIIPTEEYLKYLTQLADYLDMIGADFINLNEFEMCAPNQEILLKKGFQLRENSLAAVKHSKEFALRFLNDFKPRGGINIHYCPAASKDSVQIRKRYLRRASNIKFPYEDINEDGCLIFLRIEAPVQILSRLYTELEKESQMPSKFLGLNLSKNSLDLPSFLVEEENFIDLLSKYKLRAGIYEIIPFREENVAEIREYTPIIDKLKTHLHKKPNS